jgi:hypothetical protein
MCANILAPKTKRSGQTPPMSPTLHSTASTKRLREAGSSKAAPTRSRSDSHSTSGSESDTTALPRVSSAGPGHSVEHKVSAATAARMAARDASAKKAEADAAWKKATEDFSRTFPRTPPLSLGSPAGASQPEKGRETSTKHPHKKKVLLEPLPLTSRTEDYATPRATSREEIDDRFLKGVIRSGEAGVPGGATAYESRYKERIKDLVPAEELSARVASHMEKVEDLTRRQLAARIDAAGIDKSGMSNKQLQEHIQRLESTHGADAAAAAVSSLIRAKKMSSPSGWAPGMPR